jgi:hypothetical protein
MGVHLNRLLNQRNWSSFMIENRPYYYLICGPIMGHLLANKGSFPQQMTKEQFL